MENKEEWLKLLKEAKAFCYIKPTRHIHDSGLRCFEVGYLTMGEDNRIKDKLVLGEYSDHIQLYNWDILETREQGKLVWEVLEPNIDLTTDGYLRIYSLGGRIKYWWGSMDFVCSSAQLSKL
jgi:hypothetical protein